jgi:hypothetical protein
MVGKGVIIEALVGLTTYEDGFQNPPVCFLYQPDMQMVCAFTVASQVQDSLISREGGDFPIFQEYTL